MCRYSGIVVLICLAVDTIAGSKVKVIRTDNGLVRGLRETTLFKNQEYYAFKGIPFAKPPIGDLRFKAPEPAESWQPNVWDAFKYSNICVQPFEFALDPNPQHEDCLYLNIFVPANADANDKLAVMFFIHGGGFAEGSGNDVVSGPDFLVEKDVILVTVNYRLGILGFLSLDLPEYSGNMGLKDQQLALKWTHQNIEYFGGDQNRITIFGQSAGGGSTHLQAISAESRKYFKNAIAMSGSAVHFWSLSSVQNKIEYAYEMARTWAKPVANLNELIDVLKTISADKFIEYSSLASKIGRIFEIPNGPVIEVSNAVRPFMLQSPIDLYENSNIDVDVMFGITSEECLSVTEMNEKLASTKDLDENFEIVLPFKGVDIPFETQQYKELAADIRQFYFKNAPIDSRTKSEYTTFLSDANFAYHSHKAAEIHARKSKGKTFYYHFDVNSKLNAYTRMRGDGTSTNGAGHCDDLCYLFRCGFAEGFYDEINNDRNDEQSITSFEAIENLTKLYTNFAKYGQPLHNEEVGALRPFENGKRFYVDITNHGFKLAKDLHQKTFDFWSNVERRAYESSTVHEEL